MYCPKCASQNEDNIKFCKQCGINLSAVSDLLSGTALESPQADEIATLLAKCHNGYLSTVIGLSLIILALLIVIASMLASLIPAAISSLLLVAWAIPAVAQGIGKWRSARTEMRAILGSRTELISEESSMLRSRSQGAKTSPRGIPGSITEGTTANLDRLT